MMKKNLRRQRTLQVLPAAIALSLGVIAPFAPPQCAFAAETQTQPDGGTHYSGNFEYNSDTFVKLSTETIIKPTEINDISKGFSVNSSNFLVEANSFGMNNEGSGVYENGDFRGFFVMDMQGSSSLPLLKNNEGSNIQANALVIKYWDGAGESPGYRYKILTTDQTNLLNGDLNSVFQNINNAGLNTEAVQQEIYAAIQKNDSTKLKELMAKYLPELCFVALTDNELNNASLGQEISVNGTTESINVRWDIIMADIQQDSTSKSYSYDNKFLQAGEIWRPLDRAVAVANTFTGDYFMPKYWVTGSENCPADESNNSNLKPSSSGTEVGESYSKTEPQPLENVTTAITVKELTTGAGSIIDLSYINTSGNEPGVLKEEAVEGNIKTEYDAKVKLKRNLIADTAKLGQDTTFRLGVYSNGSDNNRTNDAVYITNAEQHDEDSSGKTNLNIQLGWVPEIKEGSAGGSWTPSDEKIEMQVSSNTLLSIYNGADKFTVTAQQSEIDGVFGTYLLLPEIGQYDDYYNTGVEGDKQGTAWYLKGYTYADTGELSESGKSVSENSTVQNNFVKANNLSLFRRSENLHGGRLNRQEAGGNGPQRDESGLAGELRENLWADVWHGKFDAKAAYARSTNQSYNGFQVGYDKLLSKKFYGGKVYTGFYASKIDGKSTTAAGKGEQDSYGVGVYSSWVGDKGHFIDLGVNAFKLKNDYHFTGNTGNGSIGKVKGDNSTWAYGIGAQYGKRNELSSNWFWEPSVSLYVGHVDESSYKLTNGLGIHEQGYDTAIGKLGLKAGKNIGDKGNIYAGVSWGHEFAGGQKLHQSYGPLNRLVETVGGSDSWWEWNVGGKVKLSPNAALNLDFIKTTGSDVGNEWSINGGLDFSWGGFGSGGSKAAKVNASGGEPSVSGGGFAKANAPTVVVGQAPKVGNVQVPQMQQTQQSIAVESGSVDSRAVYDMGEAGSSVVRDDTGSVSGTVTGGMGEFELGGLTVEAKRPDWEKNLSPGQVSVIYPAQFEGEQKNLPELLDRVPGLFVQRLNGVGHYTVARVRGSTAAQVSVYVDGVQMNLTGDAAVNLSAIPADNIERIEVYRGYVPARFAGAPLGGVINIITKKPNEGHGHITQGVKSYGGYSSTYEYSMPLGSGSLLATYARDIWHGDFDYIFPAYVTSADGSTTDKTFKRRSNGYQNSNAMLKWQDDHWTVKGVWKKQHEGLAKIVDFGMTSPLYAENGYLDNNMDLDYKEFLVGRRDTLGNLDLGWHIAYLDSKKAYKNIGGYKFIEDNHNGTLPPGLAKYEEDNFAPGQLWGTYHSKKWNINSNMAMKLGSNHLLEFNADFTRETMNTNGNKWGLTTATNYLLPNGETNFIRAMLYKYNNREYHLTLQDTITLNDDGDFKLTPILRADKVEMEGLGPSGIGDDRWMYSGGVALQKQLNDQWSFKSTWGTYNRHPNFYEIFGDGGFIRGNYVYKNKDGSIDQGMWESGSQFDFSLNWQGKLAGADTDTILTWYQRKTNNQLVLWTPRGGDGLSCYAPTGEMKVHGLELAHNMKWKRLNLALAATWQKSEELSDGLGYSYNWQGTGSSFVPEWVVSARLDYLFPGDKLNIFGEYRYTDQETLRGGDSSGKDAIEIRDSYSIVDLGLKYKFDKKWRLSAGVNDIFDKGKEVFIMIPSKRVAPYPNNYPLAGRMYYTTLEYSF